LGTFLIELTFSLEIKLPKVKNSVSDDISVEYVGNFYIELTFALEI